MFISAADSVPLWVPLGMLVLAAIATATGLVPLRKDRKAREAREARSERRAAATATAVLGPDNESADPYQGVPAKSLCTTVAEHTQLLEEIRKLATDTHAEVKRISTGQKALTNELGHHAEQDTLRFERIDRALQISKGTGTDGRT